MRYNFELNNYIYLNIFIQPSNVFARKLEGNKIENSVRSSIFTSHNGLYIATVHYIIIITIFATFRQSAKKLIWQSIILVKYQQLCGTMFLIPLDTPCFVPWKQQCFVPNTKAHSIFFKKKYSLKRILYEYKYFEGCP